MDKELAQAIAALELIQERQEKEQQALTEQLKETKARLKHTKKSIAVLRGNK